MTTVTIAHRLSTIVDSDLIAVLDHGKVKEVGDHKTLYDKNGIYTLLCATQGIGPDFTSIDNRISFEGDNSTVETSKRDIEMGIEQVRKGKETDCDDFVGGGEKVEINLTPMPTIYRYLGVRDGFYALVGLVGSIIVGALSPLEVRSVSHISDVLQERLV